MTRMNLDFRRFLFGISAVTSALTVVKFLPYNVLLQPCAYFSAVFLLWLWCEVSCRANSDDEQDFQCLALLKHFK